MKVKCRSGGPHTHPPCSCLFSDTEIRFVLRKKEITPDKQHTLITVDGLCNNSTS